MAEMRYEFGKNWQRYLKRHFSEERAGRAQRAMLEFLGRSNLHDVELLDIGSGSGLHSYAAWAAGAKRVVSFDYDPDSVAATRSLWRHAGSPAHWTVVQGSVLDPGFLAKLGTFNLVYSWGVLHHTGDMWTALENACTCVAPGGRFFLALYDRDMYRDPPPEYWLDVKRRYNHAGALERRAMEAWYLARYIIPKRPTKFIRWVARVVGSEARGMNIYTDVCDWLGGWPMEFSTVEEVTRHALESGLQTIKVRTGEENTEYLLERPS